MNRRQTLKALLAAPFLGVLGFLRPHKAAGLPEIGDPYPRPRGVVWGHARYIWVPDLPSQHVGVSVSVKKVDQEVLRRYDIVHGTPS